MSSAGRAPIGWPLNRAFPQEAAPVRVRAIKITDRAPADMHSIALRPGTFAAPARAQRTAATRRAPTVRVMASGSLHDFKAKTLDGARPARACGAGRLAGARLPGRAPPTRCNPSHAGRAAAAAAGSSARLRRGSLRSGGRGAGAVVGPRHCPTLPRRPGPSPPPPRLLPQPASPPHTPGCRRGALLLRPQGQGRAHHQRGLRLRPHQQQVRRAGHEGGHPRGWMEGRPTPLHVTVAAGRAVHLVTRQRSRQLAVPMATGACGRAQQPNQIPTQPPLHHTPTPTPLLPPPQLQGAGPAA
jgi:hypothetical protein